MGSMSYVPPNDAERRDLIRALQRVCPTVRHTEEALRPYECDGLTAIRARPLAVALPDSVEQVQAIIRLCRDRAIPVVPRGAGTGLSGGAVPITHGIVLSLAKFKQILHIDPLARTARVQPGVRNLAISQAAAPHGLYYAPDPSSQIACTIGGNVAENSGGVHCLKYGLTVHNVLQVTAVNSDGELVTYGGATLDTPGPDLLAAMIGSEGLLGVVVDVLVKLTPTPTVAKVLMSSFDDVRLASDAVTAIIAQGIIPAGLEMMDQLSLRAAEDFLHVGYPVEAAAALLCELDGTSEEVEAQIATVSALMQANGATHTRIARDDAERQQLWAGRKNAFPAVGRISPDYYCMDGTIPRARLAEVLERIAALSAQYGLAVANVFHAGDGNLHPLILFDASKDGELERAEHIGADILSLCVEVGGTITGEHGVGLEKINQMCVQFDSPTLRQFHAMKAAFDPHRLLNPDKAIPTLHRCAEFGAMHIHNGQLPHPELPRF